ncbi:MAG: methyltransferase domain-containing protein, partial [Nitrososphaera sp.]|nr:methyltransferase domain-containing protein [Nitrososphaera sp.]
MFLKLHGYCAAVNGFKEVIALGLLLQAISLVFSFGNNKYQQHVKGMLNLSLRWFIDPTKRLSGHSLLGILKYIGVRYHCPVCGEYFRHMLPFGVTPRPNAQCPRCCSLERHRLIWVYLRQRTDLFRRYTRLLHIAPEPAFRQIFAALPNIDYVSVDIASPLAMLRSDLVNLPLRDNCIDTILCVHVLEHIVDDRRAMRELFRVLRPGGWAILQTPVDLNLSATYEDADITSTEGRLRAFGQNDHVRCYGRDYKDRLEKAGFVVQVDPFVRTIP